MKRNGLIFILLCVALPLLLRSCKEEKLESFGFFEGSKSEVTAEGITGDLVASETDITVPLGISVHPAASKAFDIALSIEEELAREYVEEEGLRESHQALSPKDIAFPSIVKIPFGANTASFSVRVKRTEVEKYFGKKLVFAYSISNPSKSNTISDAGASYVVVFDSENVISEDDIQYVQITNGAGEIRELKNKVNYTSSSSGLSSQVGLSVPTSSKSPFVVEVEANNDTIAQLIQSGQLPQNTITLDKSDYTFDKIVRFSPNALTAPLELTVPWSVIEEHEDQKLAVVLQIKSTSRHLIHPELNHTVILIDSENVLEKDMTNQGVFSVNRDNSGGPDAGEGSKKLIDNNTGTKFLVGDFKGDVWAQIEFSTPQNIGAYTITSANDAPVRDPSEWNLLASDDGENWEVVDYQADEVFESRFETKRYDFVGARAYKYYRWHILANGGNSLLQIAEWRLIRVP